MKWRGPGFAPHPGHPLFKKTLIVLIVPSISENLFSDWVRVQLVESKFSAESHSELNENIFSLQLLSSAASKKRDFLYVYVANVFISPFNTQTMHTESFLNNSIAVFLKTLYPGGIRTRVFSDAMSTAPRRRQGEINRYISLLHPHIALRYA
jgi:hypothetical protein